MRYIFTYYNSSPMGVSSFYSFVEVKSDSYKFALSKIQKLLPPEKEPILHSILEEDNVFILPIQKLFEGGDDA